ncbi:MAG TPA: DUF1835 domain-containing protein [Vicinamibacterales bacterium]|jgi:hypothetical protein
MLHVTNGEATRGPLEQSGLPGTAMSWDDVLHEGPIVLAAGENWYRVRAAYLASDRGISEDQLLRDFREQGDRLAAAASHDEVVFWFEHDLHDQLLLIHHLWWLSRPEAPRTRYSIVIGTDYLGLLRPPQFPAKFASRRPITPEDLAAGAAAWTTFCGDDPRLWVPFARDAGPLVFLPRAMHRLLEELPAASNGLARSERQLLEVLSEGPRPPEQAFVAASRLEEDIWMGDSTFWTIVTRLAAGPHPLLTVVRDEPTRLASGTVTITGAGRQVLAGRADHVALNAPSRGIGGTRLSPGQDWRWTGSSVQRAAP